MKISDEELEAIDDWRFENRVPSRSEAVRRLCQIGLITDSRLRRVVDLADGVEQMADVLETMSDEVMQPHSRFHADDVHDLAANVADHAEELMVEVAALWNSIIPFGDESSIENANAVSKKVIAETVPVLGEIHERRIENEDIRLFMTLLSRWPSEVRKRYETMSPEDRDAFLKQEFAKERKRLARASEDDA